MPTVFNRFALITFSRGEWHIRLYKDLPVGPTNVPFLLFDAEITIPESVEAELRPPIQTTTVF